MHKISIVQPLPFSYMSRIAAVPGVTLVTHSTWFGRPFIRMTPNMLITYSGGAGDVSANVSGVLAASGRESALAA